MDLIGCWSLYLNLGRVIGVVAEGVALVILLWLHPQRDGGPLPQKLLHHLTVARQLEEPETP